MAKATQVWSAFTQAGSKGALTAGSDERGFFDIVSGWARSSKPEDKKKYQSLSLTHIHSQKVIDFSELVHADLGVHAPNTASWGYRSSYDVEDDKILLHVTDRTALQDIARLLRNLGGVMTSHKTYQKILEGAPTYEIPDNLAYALRAVGVACPPERQNIKKVTFAKTGNRFGDKYKLQSADMGSRFNDWDETEEFKTFYFGHLKKGLYISDLKSGSRSNVSVVGGRRRVYKKSDRLPDWAVKF